MQSKYVLGILCLILIIAAIFWGFSSHRIFDKYQNETAANGLDPSQSEPQTTPKPEPTDQPTETPTEPESTENVPNQPIPPPQQNYSISVMNAIDFLEYSDEPEAMLWLDVMHRRFGIEQFANSLQRFDQLLYLNPDHSPVTRLFRRIAVYNNPINAEDMKTVKYDVDLITIPALYCDRLDLPSNYTKVLEEGVNQGSYQLTHVLLALIWIQENNCELELPDGFMDNMYHANAALINADQSITDLELEAAAFLCLAGQSDLINEAFAEQVKASQHKDGSWGETYQKWHTTVLGLLFLLHVDIPSDTYPPTLAPK